MIWWPRKSKPRSSPLVKSWLKCRIFLQASQVVTPKERDVKIGDGFLAFFEKTTPHFSAKNWGFSWDSDDKSTGAGFLFAAAWQNDIDIEKTSSLGSTCSGIDDPVNPRIHWEILAKNMKMIKWIVFSMLLQGKKHRRPTKRSINFLLHISRRTRPAVKGATDTSNFDDYPDSDQEPPAVNALGTSGRKMDEG